jgi:redox-sensitive bicupin YhaK (pirin superfamily)
VTINGEQPAGEAEIVRLERSGSNVRICADGDSMLLVLTGEPIEEPIIGHGPFVMNSETEIHQAIDDSCRPVRYHRGAKLWRFCCQRSSVTVCSWQVP